MTAAGPRGTIFNVQRYSLQDGPGLRTTVFLKGCPLACAWCHNPESQDPAPEPVTLEGRCVHCGACAQTPLGPDAQADLTELCPSGARQWLGRELSVAELVAETLKDRIFFDQSGGGVTLSGGEPLLQPAFTVAALAALRAQGVHTALDTCGAVAQEHLLAAAAQANVVLYDLKHLDDAQHRHWTGAGNAAILANLQALGQCHDQIWVRVPVVPGSNADAENMAATARFAASIPGVRRVELLPYHNTGGAKFRRLGRTCLLDTLQPPTRAHLEELGQLFQGHGYEVILGGTP